MGTASAVMLFHRSASPVSRHHYPIIPTDVLPRLGSVPVRFVTESGDANHKKSEIEPRIAWRRAYGSLVGSGFRAFPGDSGLSHASANGSWTERDHGCAFGSVA
jgi:hypothetical protein